MMARADKTRPAGRTQAATRLADAHAFLQQAEISAELIDGPRRDATVVSSAVLAGIAAADAACGARLGEIAVGSHDSAPRLLKQVVGSERSVTALSRLLSLKSTSQYAGDVVGFRHATEAIERARRLVEFAESCLQ